MSSRLTFILWHVYTDGKGNRFGAVRSNTDIVEIDGPDYVGGAVRILEAMFDIPLRGENEDVMPMNEVLFEDDLGPTAFTVEHYEIAPFSKGEYFLFKRVDV